jgi:hypothetical protein
VCCPDSFAGTINYFAHSQSYRPILPHLARVCPEPVKGHRTAHSIMKKRFLSSRFTTTCPTWRAVSLVSAGWLLLGAYSLPALADSDLNERLLSPIKVVSTSGNVQNASALVSGNEGYTTLTMVPGGTAPMVILDYGIDVGGIPVFEVSAVSGTPAISASKELNGRTGYVYVRGVEPGEYVITATASRH